MAERTLRSSSFSLLAVQGTQDLREISVGRAQPFVPSRGGARPFLRSLVRSPPTPQTTSPNGPKKERACTRIARGERGEGRREGGRESGGGGDLWNLRNPRGRDARRRRSFAPSLGKFAAAKITRPSAAAGATLLRRGRSVGTWLAPSLSSLLPPYLYLCLSLSLSLL